MHKVNQDKTVKIFFSFEAFQVEMCCHHWDLLKVKCKSILPYYLWRFHWHYQYHADKKEKLVFLSSQLLTFHLFIYFVLILMKSMFIQRSYKITFNICLTIHVFNPFTTCVNEVYYTMLLSQSCFRNFTQKKIYLPFSYRNKSNITSDFVKLISSFPQTWPVLQIHLLAKCKRFRVSNL